MLLLNFTVSNHKSIRDECTLEFMRPSFKKLKPGADSDWPAVTYPVVGVFGPNASGKSTLIDAFKYAQAAINHSSTLWQQRPEMVHVPFALDDESAKGPSSYEFDWVFEGVRHKYGFTVTPEGIEKEWLLDLPRTRWRTLIDRDRSSESPTQVRFKEKNGLVAVTRRELILSRAILLEHEELTGLGKSLLDGIELAPFGDTNRERRLASITDSLLQQEMSFEDLTTLLQVADIGVRSISVKKDQAPPEAVRLMKIFAELVDSEAEKIVGEEKRIHIEPLESDAVVRTLEFLHKGRKKDPRAFGVNEESAGTIVWLSLITPAVEALRYGTMLVVDELDNSLHSHLVELVISLFLNPRLNRFGAQLLFTSHDTNLLSPESGFDLEAEQIWFADKDADGATEIYSLADFPHPKDANFERRYLAGRYGAVPRTAPSLLARVIGSDDS
ncbi:AAA family ATPase [Glutamicibacter sp. AOP3-A1-12]|uniref:AAA family ATPase n=1 Tax=Glutamicibacter sp. AOP3-A1-12 TaxID=3457701 RepID=UPI004034F4D9